MRASGYKRDKDDYYVEPTWCVEALLQVEQFAGTCWDPACGRGTIPKALKAGGKTTVASDIEDRGYGEKLDFFDVTSACSDNIVSNPPYGVMQAWIDHALTLTSSKVAILARLAFLEGQARREWFKTVPLARVWVSSRRISMPPGRLDVPAKGGTIAYAWFVFDHSHGGAPVIGWLP